MEQRASSDLTQVHANRLALVHSPLTTSDAQVLQWAEASPLSKRLQSLWQLQLCATNTFTLQQLPQRWSCAAIPPAPQMWCSPAQQCRHCVPQISRYSRSNTSRHSKSKAECACALARKGKRSVL